MFDIGWGEFVVIGIVALIAIGPKELPGVLRSLGQWVTKLRRMASEFQGQFQEAMREAEMAELKKEVEEMTAAAGGLSDFDPMATVRKEVESAMAPIAPAAPAGPGTVVVPQPSDTLPTPESTPSVAVETRKPGGGQGG
jgi:sec-independent protein translocase protein TatB